MTTAARFMLLAASAILLACGCGGDSRYTCRGDSECSSGLQCRGGLCVNDGVAPDASAEDAAAPDAE